MCAFYNLSSALNRSATMSSAESRNIRRRIVEDEEDDGNDSVTPTISKIKGDAYTKSESNKPTTKTPKKSPISFADDDDEESPFSPPPSSSSRVTKPPFSHKLSSRSGPHHPSVPSNIQTQTGVYTREVLLELQKNSKTLARKPGPQPETNK